MALSPSDRQSFSLYIVQATAQIAGIAQAQAQLQTQITNAQAIDTANDNLFIPVNNLINGYQNEFNYLDGNVRTTIVEQNILDSANKKLQNYFFPNDSSITVPSLSSSNNIWTQNQPFALSYALGKNYTQGYGSMTYEGSIINTILGYITSASAYMDIENTTGQSCTTSSGTCSNPAYTDQIDCVNNGGTWTPGTDTISSYPAVVTLKTNMVTAVNSLISLITAEVATITTNDPNSSNQTQNNTAIAYINNTLLPALNTWIAYPDFNPVPGSVTTCVAFYAYNPALLAPTKLNSAELTTLQTVLNNRLSFITTRVSQLDTVLGSISQDVTTGNIASSSGFYGTRYSYLALRLNALNGSLTQLNSLQTASNAQTNISQNITQTQATYSSLTPTSLFAAAASGTVLVNLLNASIFNVGDTVYVMADNQTELQMAIKAINNNSVTLNAIVPSKYTPATNGRLYKDVT